MQSGETTSISSLLLKLIKKTGTTSDTDTRGWKSQFNLDNISLLYDNQQSMWLESLYAIPIR